jgi:uncharacterized protein (TIRG00374 family)
MSETNNKQPIGLSLRRNIFSLRTLVSFAVAIAFVGFLATTFDVDWSRTWDKVRSLNPWLYVAAMLVYYSTFPFRGLRWKILAYNAGMGDEAVARTPSVLQFSQLILISWFVNGIAPLRLGDGYRAYALSEESGGGFSWSLGTILAERLVDMLTVFFLVVIAVLWYSATRGIGGIASILTASVVMAVVGIAVLILLTRGYGARVAQHLPSRFEGAYRRFQEGTLGSLRQRQRRAIFALGLVGWLLEMARLYLVMEAVDLTVTLPLVMIVALGHGILSIVPSPGGVGAVEPGLTALLVLGMAKADAPSVVLVDRSITLASVLIIGGLAFLLWQVFSARRRSRWPEAAGDGLQKESVVEA